MNEDTISFKVKDIKEAETKDTIKKVMKILDDAGYNSMDQLVGYIISGDQGYITSTNNARKMISKIDRSQMVYYILKEYIK